MDIRVQLSGWFEVAARLTAKPKLSISIGEENTSLLHLDADPALSLRDSAVGTLLSSKSMPHSPLSLEKPSPSRSASSMSTIQDALRAACSSAADESEQQSAPVARTRAYAFSSAPSTPTRPTPPVLDTAAPLTLALPEHTLCESERLLFEQCAAALNGVECGRVDTIADGEGGVYLLRAARSNVPLAILKPADQELGARLNHMQRCADASEQPRMGIMPGTGALREVAAARLDRGSWASVPDTVLVRVAHPAVEHSMCTPDGRGLLASLQRFVPDACSADDLSSSKFSVCDVHHVGVLDLRLLNTDRHGGNLLVQRAGDAEPRLHPIDHGLCLPTTLSETYAEWQYWPQASVPFDAATLRYIAELDLAADLATLQELGLPVAAQRNLVFATLFLQEAARSGHSLAQIANMMCRPCPGRGAPSLFEKLVAQVQEIDDCENDDDQHHHRSVVSLEAPLFKRFRKLCSSTQLVQRRNTH